ncbi:GNAT family N-acetyltransferase [Saccharibacillus alkalitolerans]|uniref:GNAT family N-acetyltransferase n=1 Tax=Saccharibacillus alkalitolerans TaxID=2705290 RepID=A0ABX0F000_9BACL|nr:GNAT family N-acetyltransferase [Saccharibacillus alkalitolerans]NGZ74331.1 GNAT family N-acetyltransferase [Saccharibacillus alkalitolerans]
MEVFGLNEKQIQDIELLQRVCEQADGLFLKLNFDMLKMDSRKENMDFFRYENGQLVGFLALYGFGGQFEVCGMVHPAFRRRGIFTGLWQEALDSGQLDGADSVLLNAPHSSASAAGWLKTIPCRFGHAEHEMKWTNDPDSAATKQADESNSAPNVSVSYRPYEPKDRDLVVRLYADGFDMSETDTESMLEEESGSGNRRRSMVVHLGQTVGTFVMDYDTPEQSWVFAFVIDRSHRGQGIGRNLLSQIIRRENGLGRTPYISVETRNEHALGLYESCGFRSYAVQDYYEFLR